jgi:hypothetical protein
VIERAFLFICEEETSLQILLSLDLSLVRCSVWVTRK